MEGIAYARAGLLGNPSDGYFGKTLSMIVKNFRARVTCEPSDKIVIVPACEDQPRYPSLAAMREKIKLHGYYGGVRVLKASIKRFSDYCIEQGISLPEKGFTLTYESNIPRLVGMSGSSAIVTATFRALMAFFDVEIPKQILPNWTISTETQELKIPGGLQDRVMQSYEGVVYMDFSKTLIESRGYGEYEPLDPKLLPPIYLAYMTELGEGSEVFHSNLRERFDRGDEQVVAAMRQFAGFAEQGRKAFLDGDTHRFSKLMDENFDLRASLYTLGSMHHEMIGRARAVGASAKFAGSGGATVGVYKDEKMLHALEKTLGEMGAKVIVPQVQ